MIVKKIINYDTHTILLRLEKSIEYFVDPNTNTVRTDWIEEWKNYLKCDAVLNSQTHVMFGNVIEEAIIV